MSKFSVKKPLTIFVAVIAVLVLGVVAYTRMTPDLLPNMDFPYVMIMTTYPGASPEEVEMDITKPMEQNMASLEHIKEITSTSAENYSMVVLEFEEGTDLDVIGVDIQQKISAMSDGWDETVSAPYVLKINPSLLPVMVAAVSEKSMDTKELTRYIEEELMTKLEGISGVARVSTAGTIQQEIHVVMDKTLIEITNEKIVNAVNGKMDEALDGLNGTKNQLLDAQSQLEAGEDALQQGQDAVTGPLLEGEAQLDQQQMLLMSTRTDLVNQLSELKTAKSQLETTMQILEPILEAIEALETQWENQQKTLQELKDIQTRLEELNQQKLDFDGSILAIEMDITLTQQEKEAAIAEITDSEAYKKMETDRAALEQQMALYGVTETTVAARITLVENTVAEVSRQAEELKQLLRDQGFDPDALVQTLQQMDENIALLDAGIAALEEGIAQIDSGLLELSGAKALLNQQKTEAIMQIVTGAAELQIGKAAIESAMAQIDGGIDTIESTRKETLAAVDMTKILTLETVSGLLTAQNFSMPAGMVEGDGVSYMVSVGEPIATVTDLENLLLFDVGIDGVEPIYLKDVAAVVVTDNAAQTYAKLNGVDSVMLTFEKQSTYATAEVTDNIQARFAQLEKEHPGLAFVPLMNQGDYIYMIVRQILSSLFFGAVFAVLVLFLFLKDWRPTFITLCSIPISVIFAIVLMYFSGVTLNMISLSGLAVAVGMLVDNSVVVIENIYRLRSKGANAIQAAVSGAKQVAGAVISSTLTTVCVFLPIVFVEGITRQLFTDLALTMTYALLASLIVAMTLVPAMASGLLKKEKLPKTGLMDKVLGGYHKAAEWALGHKAVVLVVSAVLLVGSMVWSMSRGFIFMEDMDMPTVTVTVTMPEGTDMEEATQISDQVIERIGAMEGVETVGAMMSGGVSLSSDTEENYDVTVYVVLADDKASGEEAGRQIAELCKDLPCEISSSSAMMDTNMLTGEGISLQIYGNDMSALQAAAEKAADLLSRIDGVAEVSNGLEELAPALHVQIDRNKAMSEGVTVAQIYMQIASALQNETTVTGMELDGVRADVIIDKPRQDVLTADTLEDFVITFTTQTGEEKSIVLSDVATVEETASLQAISRLQQRRYLTVTAILQPGVNVTIATAQAEKLMGSADLGQGVTYAFAGENEAIMEAVGQMMLMLVLGVLLVYLVMVAQFQSLKSPFIVMFTIPLAFTGGFMALILCGMEVSVISLVGFVMLTGIIVNNGIVLVDYINQLRQEGMERRAAIIEAGKTRMRPILMTTFTTILGLLVMALSRSAGNAMMRPVAIVCIGGLLYATLMTLFVVPCIYDMFNKKELRKVDEEDLKILDI